MISIIIPVYNEENVLARCIDSILKTAEPDEFEVILVCNGCVDNSQKIAESYGNKVTVVVSEPASKTIALNKGDEMAHHFPRFYLDADILITTESIRKVAALLTNQEQILAAAPKVNFDTSNANFWVKQFYKVWQLNPYFNNMIGSGIYAVSETGRKKFDKFPFIINDDEYFRLQFNDLEIKSAQSATFQVITPSNIKSLVKIKTRVRLGSYELRNKYPNLVKSDKKDYFPFIKTIMTHPTAWLGAVVYGYVLLSTRFAAKKRLKDMTGFVWDKDDSSRNL
jgi:glycosyltransferase involved in cell wall biosynthesis